MKLRNFHLGDTSKPMKRLAETYEDKEYAAEVIERIYNEVTSCEDIGFILDCKKLLLLI